MGADKLRITSFGRMSSGGSWEKLSVVGYQLMGQGKVIC